MQAFRRFRRNDLEGAIVVWDDHRSGSGLDLYAQRIAWPGLPTPTLITMMAADATPEGIRVQWQFADAAAFQSVSLARASETDGGFETLPVEAKNVSGVMCALDTDVVRGSTYWYRIAARASDGQEAKFVPVSATALERVTNVALAQIVPNPSHGPMQVEFTLPLAMRARIDVVDALGRDVAILKDEWFAAGRHREVWAGRIGRGDAPAGIYFIRLRAGGKLFARRAAFMR